MAKTAKENNEATEVNASIAPIELKIISMDKLQPYPRNVENISETVDLETSIADIGFIDPLEVTDFNMKDGEYMIVSGHRRYTAAYKLGFKELPCLIRHFSDDLEVFNYTLLANCHRDSSNDPLLLFRRYKGHEAYLISIEEKSSKRGSYAEIISGRLGVSARQARRLASLSRVIAPVIDLVAKRHIALSSAALMADLDNETQKKIYDILVDNIVNDGSDDAEISRNTVSRIINHVKTAGGAAPLPAVFGNGNSDDFSDDYPSGGNPYSSGSYTSGSSYPEPDYDYADGDDYDDDDGFASDLRDNNKDDFDDDAGFQGLSGAVLSGITDEALSDARKHGSRLLAIIGNLANGGYRNCDWDYLLDDDAASDAIRKISVTVVDLIDEIKVIAGQYNVGDSFEEIMASIDKAAAREKKGK